MSTPEKNIARGSLTGRPVLGYLSVLGASALFGSAFTLAKPLLVVIDPLLLSALIYTISGIALIPFAKASFILPRKIDYAYILLITGLGAVAAPILLLYGLKQTEASDASVLTNGEVVFTIILSSIFFGDKPKGKVGLFAVGLVIVGLFVASTNIRLSASLFQPKTGDFLILASMFFWAIDNNVSRRLVTKSPTISASKIAMLKSLLGGAIMIAMTVSTGRWYSISDINYNLWPLIIAVAVTGFGGALLLFIEGIKRIGTIKTMCIFSTTPVFGIIIAASVLGELITIFQIAATAMIISGIVLVSTR